MKSKIILSAVLAWLGVMFTGCESVAVSEAPPVYVPRNHEGLAQMPEAVRRVVLLPVAGSDEVPPETLHELDAILLTALQNRTRFEVVPMTRTECHRRYGRDALNSVSVLPAGLMSDIRDHHAADAVLFVDLTAHRPYRPQLLGLRAKLVLAEGDEAPIVWSFDEIISAENPAVAASVRRHFYRPDRPVDISAVALQSPGRFATYAADVMFATLPPR